MPKKKIKRIDLKLIQIFLFIIPFLFGLFYEFTSYFAQIYLLIVLSIKLIKEKKIRIYLNFSSISLVTISLGYLCTCIYAIDRGMAFLGFLKFTIPITFSILLMQYKKQHIRKMLNVIPMSGIAMIIISATFKYVPFLPDSFYLPNGRMGGFFQYSNTFALFLLIGIICLVNSKQSKLKIILGTAILLIGIYISGSRTVFVLTILNFIIFIIKLKKLRKMLIALLGISIIASIGYAAITNNFQTIGRYLTTSLNSSTLLGRILYYKDAIPQILQHPFGLGYKGYSYLQPIIQTGVYTAVYVHNEFLQIALDIGIIPMIIFSIVILKVLINKEKFDITKQILLTIVIHMLIDFDLQFLSIFLILIMTLNIYNGKKYIYDANKTITIISTSIVSIIYLYFAICTLLNYLNKSEIAIKMYPIYTEANESLMYEYSEKDLEKANKIASEIIETNTNIALTYNVKSLYYMQNENWKLMIKNKQKSLEINKYDISNYEEYILMLSMAIDYYINKDDINNAMNCIKLVVEVPSKIEQVKSSTDHISYKINDIPDFELSENVQNYILKMKGVLEND